MSCPGSKRKLTKADILFRYDKETGTGGSNGATMRFAPEGDHSANAGLKAARDFLEPIKGKASLRSCSLQNSGFIEIRLIICSKMSLDHLL